MTRNPDDDAADTAADQERKAAARQRPVDVMELLQEHVPLTLLADLAEKDGPASPVILETEGLPEHAWWEKRPDEDQD